MNDADRAALESDLKHAEGLRLKAYQDSEGVWTIGYGCNLQQLSISEMQAVTWLRQAMAQSEAEAQRFQWFALCSPARQRAVVELLYNLGWSRLQTFKRFLAAMADTDYEDAAAQLLNSLWARQVGSIRSTRIADLIRHG